MGWKPGHHLLLALSLYALVVTWGFYVRGRALSAEPYPRLPLPTGCPFPTSPGPLGPTARG